MPKNVDLGFYNGDYPAWGAEREYESFEVESRYFPSKVGGKPAWLDLQNLPSSPVLTCQYCSQQLVFLLQVYAPGSGARSFHRTIFVFICSSGACWNKKSEIGKDAPVVVLRSQLSRENRFYPVEPPEERPGWRTDIVPEKFGTLCPVCGGRGDKSCGRCRQVAYCSQSHQKLDWKKGHKQECTENGKYGGPHASVGFPEGLLEIEEEPEKDEKQNDSQDYKHLIDPNMEIEEAISEGVTEDEWNQVESGQTNDKASEKFNSRVRRAPQQIIRYQRSGEPLLCTFTAKLPEISACSKCGGQRSFEFQVMPQILCVLGLGSELQEAVDWGSIYIFTCNKDCDIEGYVEEFAAVLDFDKTNLPEVPQPE